MTVHLLGAADVRALAARLGVSPTKKLGQNFMIDPGTVRRIVTLSGVGPETPVVEVGPGLGSLTLGLLAAGAAVTAVEIDPLLAAQLPLTVAERTTGLTATDQTADQAAEYAAESVAHAPGQSAEQSADQTAEPASPLCVIQADALRLAAGQLVEQGGLDPAQPFCLVSNLPYNVATPILLTFLEKFAGLRSALVLVQNEVAERLAAQPGSKIYGAPSVKLAWYGQASKAGSVGRSVFWPVPNVDSSLVAFKRWDNSPSAAETESVTARPSAVQSATAQSASQTHQHPADLRELTFRLIDAAFAQRRKTLRAALRDLVSEEQIRAAGIDPSLRGERLAVDDFLALAAAVAGQDTSQQ